jgi:DNA-binding transcriptional regulator GbsR (MarR family)
MPLVLTKCRRDMIETGGRLFQLLGLPRSTGQIYGLLYLATNPLSLDDIVQLIGISKASASTGTRQLSAWGAVRQVWVPGNRRDYFEAVTDFGGVIRGTYTEFLKPRLSSSQKRLETLSSSLEEDRASGAVSRQDYQLCVERLKNLTRLQARIQRLMPLAEKLF